MASVVLRSFLKAPQRADWPGHFGPIDLDAHDLPHESSATEWWYFNTHFTGTGTLKPSHTSRWQQPVLAERRFMTHTIPDLPYRVFFCQLSNLGLFGTLLALFVYVLRRQGLLRFRGVFPCCEVRLPQDGQEELRPCAQLGHLRCNGPKVFPRISAGSRQSCGGEEAAGFR